MRTAVTAPDIDGIVGSGLPCGAQVSVCHAWCTVSQGGLKQGLASLPIAYWRCAGKDLAQAPCVSRVTRGRALTFAKVHGEQSPSFQTAIHKNSQHLVEGGLC